MVTPDLGHLAACAQSVSGPEQAEAIVARTLDCALAALGEHSGFALVRTPLGALRVAACQGLTQQDEATARASCGPGSRVVRAIEDGHGQLLPADNDGLARGDIRFVATVPFLALGKPVGGMVLFLRAEPDKPLWEEGLPYIGASTGLALAQVRFKEAIATGSRLASLGRVTAGVAHELRNPLTVLGTTLALLRHDPQLGEDAQKKLIRAQDAFNRVVNLIDGLSGFSKPPRPTAELVRLSDLFSALLDLLGSEARSRKITVEVRISPPSLAVTGDWGRLLEVLINLVENAMDAIGRDGQIALQADPARGKVCIAVRDSGPGIAPDVLDRIFEPFFTTKANGTGLGLSIVREIIEQLGGVISVKSRAGAGTEFFVTLPSG